MSDIATLDVTTPPPIYGITGLNLKARDAIPGTSPYNSVDYRNESNPYMDRYGVTWEQEIDKSTTLSKFKCVDTLVNIMMTKSARMMMGIKHQDDWYFHHDALLLMTAK